MMFANETPQPHAKRPKLLIIVLVTLCIVGIGSGVFFYLQYSQVQAKANQKQELTERISKLVELPNETSTLVTVADKSRLQNKQLAEKVSDGDVLMIFSQNRRLIIYRPDTNKIVDMLTFTDQESSTLPVKKP